MLMLDPTLADWSIEGRALSTLCLRMGISASTVQTLACWHLETYPCEFVLLPCSTRPYHLCQLSHHTLPTQPCIVALAIQVALWFDTPGSLTA